MASMRADRDPHCDVAPEVPRPELSQRIQNQHAENRVLRMLDSANIGLGIQGFLRTAN